MNKGTWECAYIGAILTERPELFDLFHTLTKTKQRLIAGDVVLRPRLDLSALDESTARLALLCCSVLWGC